MKLVELTIKEQEDFLKDFDGILKKHSVYYEPIPQFVRGENNTWVISIQLLIQKKVEEEGIPSPFAKDETNKKD